MGRDGFHLPESDASASYLWGDDVAGGWGRRFFFSFYTEWGYPHHWAVAEACLLSAVLAVSVLANLWIAGVVLYFRDMRTVTNLFLLNLAAADLFFAMGIPLVAAARLLPSWALGDLACRLLPYSEFVCGFVLLWTLTLIAMDRYRCIVVPPYQSDTTFRRASVLTVLTWAVAAVIFLPVAFWFREQVVSPPPGGDRVRDRDLEPQRICTLVFPRWDYVPVSLLFTVPVLLVACILPLGLFVLHYYGIYRQMVTICQRWSPTQTPSPSRPSHSARRGSDLSFVGNLIAPWNSRAKRHSGLPAPEQGSGSGSGSVQESGSGRGLTRQEAMRLNRHTRVVGLVFLNVIVVLVMWLPITIVMSLIYLDGSRPNDDVDFFLRSRHFVWALMAALLNTAVNPLLISFFNENFRACLRRVWRRACGGGRRPHLDPRARDGTGVGASRSQLDGHHVPEHEQVKRAPCYDMSRTPTPSAASAY